MDGSFIMIGGASVAFGLIEALCSWQISRLGVWNGVVVGEWRWELLSARIGSVDVGQWVWPRWARWAPLVSEKLLVLLDDMDARDGTSQHLAVFIDIDKDPPTICALPAPVTQVPAPPNDHAPCIALLVQRQRIHDELLATLFASSTTLRELEETEETAESLKVKS
ncbi:uncharacterized protein L203_102703 [Cryptococcus depauperatus CBS 7841]|uniref:Uncharacterized protein n=1 Tax=Cryptococcus depauperatus CBS 7841 TaxID=1295531 RepID=A0AAJ8M023_9TREE